MGESEFHLFPEIYSGLIVHFMSAPNIETIVSLSKRRGFVYPASEIYGGLGSSWDYGPLGVELANNIKKSWWNWLVYERDDIEGVDSAIIQNRLVWKYSGHEETFSDPMVDCRSCKSRFREDIAAAVEVDAASWRARGTGERLKEWLARQWEYLL